MKENYNQNQLPLEQVASLSAKRNIDFDKAKTALLVIDMQEYFLNPMSHAYIPASKNIIQPIKQLQDYCLKNNILIIQTKHVNTLENAGQMAKWWHAPILELNNPLAQIIPAIAHPKIKQITKSQYDAFYNSKLEASLKKHNIEQIIITGVMTHLCCETTARVAFTRGYEVFVSIDATATYDSALQSGALLGMAHGFAMPLLTSKILAQLERDNVKN